MYIYTKHVNICSGIRTVVRVSILSIFDTGTTPPLARKCKDEFPDLFTYHSLISA
jgi:hypothetical protein